MAILGTKKPIPRKKIPPSDQTVGDSIKSSVPTDCRRVGIEIEVEKVHTATSVQYWNVVKEDSLRNGGQEFVSHPIPLKDVEHVLEDFYKAFDKYGYQANVRTGIHVHIDARDFKAENIGSIATAYALMEPAFFQVVGQVREENIYCVPWYRADTDVVQISKIFRGNRNSKTMHRGMSNLLSGLQSRTCKYSGMYLEPLRRFGTVEFRHAPTWATISPTLEWVNMCYRFVEWSKAHKPWEIISLHRGSPRQLVYDVLGPQVKLPMDYNDLVDELDVEILAETLADAAVGPEEDLPEIGEWERIAVEDAGDSDKPHPSLKAEHPVFSGVSSGSYAKAVAAMQAQQIPKATWTTTTNVPPPPQMIPDPTEDDVEIDFDSEFDDGL